MRGTLEKIITELVEGTMDFKIAQRVVNATNAIIASIKTEMQYIRLKSEVQCNIDYMENSVETREKPKKKK